MSAAGLKGRELAVAALRIGLGLLFAYAAVTKLADPSRLAEDIANYRLVPARLIAPLAATLPGIELVAAALLVLGACARAAAAVVAILMAVFTAALAQALARGINLSCGCFGASTETASTGTVLRDLAFLSWAVAVTVLSRGPRSSDVAAVQVGEPAKS